MALGTGDSLITTSQQLQGLIDHLRSIGRFAFDTEFVSEETFEPVLCLIQVATRSGWRWSTPWRSATCRPSGRSSATRRSRS